MAYYSMYYMVLALLFATGIKCENHSGAIILLERLYGIDNHRIAAAKRDRIDKQYYIDFAITAEEVRDSIGETEAFCADLYDFMEGYTRATSHASEKKRCGFWMARTSDLAAFQVGEYDRNVPPA